MLKRNGFTNNIFTVAMFDIISKIFSVVISIILIRILTINEYAEFTIFNSIATFVHGIIGSGLSLAFVKYYVEQKTRKNNKNQGLFFFSIGYIFVLYLILSLISPVFKNLLNTNVFIIWISLMYGLTLSLNQLNQAYYQAREMYSKSGIISNIKYVILIFYFIVLFILIKNYDTNAVFIGYILCTSIAFVIGLIFIFKNNERFLNASFSNFISMISDSAWLILYMFILNMFNQADIFMINKYLDDIELSNYGVAFKYYGIMLTLLSSIQVVLRVKTASKDIIDDVNKQRAFTINWIKKIAPISFCISLITMISSWYIFPIINGEQYNASILTFNILMIGAGLSYITAPNMNIMRASGRHKLLCLIALGALCINIVGNYLFIPTYGINAAAITTVISQFFLNGSATFAILIRKNKS